MSAGARSTPTEVCPVCTTRVKLSRDGRGRRVVPFHRHDGKPCRGTGTIATTQDDDR